MLVKKLPHKITGESYLPVRVCDDYIVHAKLIANPESIGHPPEHVDRTLHKTDTSEVNHKVVGLNFAWYHGVLDCITCDEIKSV